MRSRRGLSRTVIAQQPPAPPTPRAQAPVDLTGYWVSIVTEDWRWRMVTPPKGDYASIPMTPAARKVADAWDPKRDAASGEACRAYGAGAIMRVPGRIHITWENDTTLRVDTEAGTQTRLFRFGAPGPAAPAAPPSWQGRSAAQWQISGGRRGAPPAGGSLRVVTTGLRPGYLRKNGVPYSANAVVTEYLQPHERAQRRHLARGDDRRGRPDVSERPVRHQLAFQESGGRVSVEPHALRGDSQDKSEGTTYL